MLDPSREIRSEQLPSVRELFYVVMSYKWMVWWVFTAVLGATALTVFYLRTPLFEATSTVVINVGNIAMPMMDGVPPSDFEKLSTFQTQKDVIKSIAIAGPVVDNLRLDAIRVLSKFDVMRIWIRNQRRILGKWFDVDRWKKPEDPRALAIEAVLGNLEIISKPESQALKLTYRAHSPKEAEITLKHIIDEYSGYFYSHYRQRAEGQMGHLESQRAQVRTKLSNAEVAMLKFRRADKMVLERASPAVQAVGLDQTKAGSGKALVGRRGPTEKDPNNPGLGDPSLVGITDSVKVQDELKLNILAMEQELRRLRAMYSDTTPEVRDLRVRIDRYVAALNTLPARELELFRLKRELDATQEVFLHLNRSIERARIYSDRGMDRTQIISVVDVASADDDPVSPKPRLAMLLAIVFGSFFAVASAFILDYLDPTIRSVRDAERSMGLRVLGSLSKS